MLVLLLGDQDRLLVVAAAVGPAEVVAMEVLNRHYIATVRSSVGEGFAGTRELGMPFLCWRS